MQDFEHPLQSLRREKRFWYRGLGGRRSNSWGIARAGGGRSCVPQGGLSKQGTAQGTGRAAAPFHMALRAASLDYTGPASDAPSMCWVTSAATC